jgi:hypothetical protein
MTGHGRGGNIYQTGLVKIGTISLGEENDAQVVPGTGDECLFGIAVGRSAKEQCAE